MLVTVALSTLLVIVAIRIDLVHFICSVRVVVIVVSVLEIVCVDGKLLHFAINFVHVLPA